MPDSRSVIRFAPILLAGLLGVFFGVALASTGTMPPDTGIYYRASDLDHLYGHVWLADGDYVYSPAFALAIMPLRVLGPSFFVVAWTTLLFLAFGIAGRWFGLAIILAGVALIGTVGSSTPATLPFLYLTIGNAQVLIAAAIVLGFRWPALWSVVLLTKMLPGIGLLWFAVRREWKPMAWALGATLLAAGAVAVVAPTAWPDYLRFLWENRATPSTHELAPVPLWACLLAAVSLIVWGARGDRRWTLPLACGMASLALYQWSYVVIWVGAAALAPGLRMQDLATNGRTFAARTQALLTRQAGALGFALSRGPRLSRTAVPVTTAAHPAFEREST